MTAPATAPTMAPERPSFGYAGTFTPSRTRKKRRGREAREPPSPSVLLSRASDELQGTGWLQECQQGLRDALDALHSRSPRVLCLGLGSPAGSRDARAQLAFLLAVCEDLSLDRQNVSIYDPVFTEEDIQLLDSLNVRCLAENRRARYSINTPTIIFMPHCDLQLYETLLRENWSRARLPNLLLIANRLSDYAENAPSRKFSAEHPCTWRLTPYLTCRPLPTCPAFPTAFNNTSIQYTCLEDLAAVGDSWWDPPHPSPEATAARPDGEPDGDSQELYRADV